MARPKSDTSTIRPATRLVASVARRRALMQSGEVGMTTAEYAVGTVAACGFGGVLWKVIESPSVTSAIGALFARALSALF